MARISALKGRTGGIQSGPSSTFNGAAVRRAVHVRYERPPVLDDVGAFKLIDRKSRLLVRIPPLYRKFLAPQQLQALEQTGSDGAARACSGRMHPPDR